MTNFEFYKEALGVIKSQMMNDDNSRTLCDFVKTYAFIPPCRERKCGVCSSILYLWLMEEYREPEMHWNKTETNTPFLAGDDGNGPWPGRHFAKEAATQ